MTFDPTPDERPPLFRAEALAHRYGAAAKAGGQGRSRWPRIADTVIAVSVTMLGFTSQLVTVPDSVRAPARAFLAESAGTASAVVFVSRDQKEAIRPGMPVRVRVHGA